MSKVTLTHLIEQTENLTFDEQLRLATHLIENARKAHFTALRRRKWREILGLVPYPVTGEDIQVWVSQSRRQADEQREQNWK
jgi:hypothetical protein